MTAEICMFNKFGFCKIGENCRKIHLVEICLKDVCEARKCDKRHPRPCKFYNQKGFCRFENNCKFSHKPNKTIQEQNLKIEALETKTEMLLRMIEEQKATIESLKAKMEGKHFEVVDIEKEKENTVESIEVAKEIVFEPIITKKKKWAMKDQIFAELVAQQFNIIETGQEYFDKEKDHFDCIKEEFINAAEILENEAKDRKITSKELKAAIQFFIKLTNRSDFTKQYYKEVVTKAQEFIYQEMKKVDD